MRDFKRRFDILKDAIARVIGYRRADAVLWVYLDNVYQQRIETKRWVRM